MSDESIKRHRLVSKVYEWADAFQAGAIDVLGLAQNLSALGDALEGDVPREVRRAIANAASALEIAHFGSGEEEARTKAEGILVELDEAIMRSGE
jgi:hypothetical protein